DIEESAATGRTDAARVSTGTRARSVRSRGYACAGAAVASRRLLRRTRDGRIRGERYRGFGELEVSNGDRQLAAADWPRAAFLAGSDAARGRGLSWLVEQLFKDRGRIG